jgi:murein DD-endopeptidase MepM/ murein hydrolase activator NlpD
MGNAKNRRRGLARAAIAVSLAALVGACADQSGPPAPVFFKGDNGPPPMAIGGPPPGGLTVTVRPGQTLDGFAYTYHLPRAAIIAANSLQPPYKLKAGMHLVIPNAGPPPVHTAMATPAPTARPLPPPTPMPPVPQAATPQPPPAQAAQPVAPPSAAKAMPDIVPLDGPPPPKQAAAVAPPPAMPATLSPPQAAGPQPVMPPRNPAAALPLPGEEPALPAAAADAGPATGRFPWPVRGKVLASYGSTTGGVHNDGINIAAPRGTPVHAIDSGTVAYAGNEVKGYGNLVLIRHANGWISAYAHLDDVKVKVGDTVTSGEAFAKVGDSGGAPEPQLHFELRRGKKPVDPKEFLAPAPSAAGEGSNRAG